MALTTQAALSFWASALLHCCILAAQGVGAQNGWQIDAQNWEQASSLTQQAYKARASNSDTRGTLGGKTIDEEWFDDWCRYCKRTYKSPSERSKAFKNFQRTLDLVQKQNSGAASTWWAAPNCLADLPDDEALARLAMKADDVKVQVRRLQENSDFLTDNGTDSSGLSHARKLTGGLPKKVDWKKKGKVTPPKWQGYCGGCWAYAAATAIESAYAIGTGTKGKSIPIVSAQQFLDCTNSQTGFYSSGCNGGMANEAFTYGAQKPLALESQYPDKDAAPAGKCMKSRLKGKVIQMAQDGGQVQARSEQALKKAVAKQPVVAYFAVGQDFIRYAGGVFRGSCPNAVNHGLVVYGYDDKKKIWLAQNSWGENWGAKGTIQLPMTGDGNGPCMLYSFGAFPSTKWKRTLKGSRRGAF